MGGCASVSADEEEGRLGEGRWQRHGQDEHRGGARGRVGANAREQGAGPAVFAAPGVQHHLPHFSIRVNLAC